MTQDEEENAVRKLGELIGYGRVIAISHNLRINPKPVDLSRGHCIHRVSLAYRCRTCENEQAFQQTPGA